MKKPMAYIKELSILLLKTRVTDMSGQALSLDEGAALVLKMIARMQITGGKALLIGNGGSAAIASHMQMDLCNSGGVRAQVFYDQPQLTALANDFDYEHAFEHSIKLWAGPEDVLVAISSSGQSENILRAAAAAREKGCEVITFSGFSADNPLRSLGEVNFYIASMNYGLVEMAHSVLGHYLTDAVAQVHRDKEERERPAVVRSRAHGSQSRRMRRVATPVTAGKILK